MVLPEELADHHLKGINFSCLQVEVNNWTTAATTAVITCSSESTACSASEKDLFASGSFMH